MIETLKSIFLILSALLPIVNPLGNTPFFLSLTRDDSTYSRWVLARRIALNSLFLLIGSYLIGTHILAFFGISLPVVQVGGGLVVISTGWTLLKKGDDEERTEAHRQVSRESILSRAFYPLTLPLTVGPGSMSIAITLGANAPRSSARDLVPMIAAMIGMVLVAIAILLSYGFADRLAKVLGQTAMSVLMRLSSFLLVCIGVQIFWNGASALLESIPR